MPSLLLIDYLDRARSVYQLLQHRPAYTAIETARLLAIPPRRFAKVVMLRLDDELTMLVVPAHCCVDTEAVRRACSCQHVEVASLRYFRARFPLCEEGAMPPFGHLFGLRAFSSGLVDDLDIAFKSGAHHETVVMPISEFHRLAYVEPLPACSRPAGRMAPALMQRRRLQPATASSRPLPAGHLGTAGWQGRLAGPG